jgi:hypothetical protein
MAASVVVAVLVDWIVSEVTAAEMARRLDSVLVDLHGQIRTELGDQARQLIDSVHQARQQMIRLAFHPGVEQP